MSGTFEPERRRPRYGLTKNIRTHNPLRIAFHEWAGIFRDIRASGRLRDALGYLLRPLGWRPDDARDARTRAAAAE